MARFARHTIALFLAALGWIIVPAVRGDPPTADNQTADSDQFRLEQLLPSSIAQNTDINAWGWFSYLHDSDYDSDPYLEADVALGVTERLGDRLAATADVHYVAENTDQLGFLEQAFVTADLSDQTQTLLTIGKFNADMGVEGRNEWDRLTGTTSLLFGAQPEDLVGLLLTQPIGDSGVTLKPFLATQFDGHADFEGAPSAGVIAQDHPNQNLTLSLTNWYGPGYTYRFDQYFYDYYDYYPFENWRGVQLHAARGGELYFVDSYVNWTPYPDVTLAAQGLFASVGPSAGYANWGGFLLLANYDLSDRWRVFTQWSYLNDPLWIITGTIQTRQEVSGGLGYQFIPGMEIRGEYRHDFSSKGDLDTLSVHLVFSF
jgi:Putative beta-barrel porin-2, OmpL-like. bbp2